MTVLAPFVGNPSVNPAAPIPEPGEAAVREYAYHLYRQGRSRSGHALDDWLEAKACLKAHIPVECSHRRLHLYQSSPDSAPLIARYA